MKTIAAILLSMALSGCYNTVGGFSRGFSNPYDAPIYTPASMGFSRSAYCHKYASGSFSCW